MLDQKFILIQVSALNIEQADTIVTTLVQERLVSCGSILPGMRSIYRWQGTLEKTEEVLVLLKSRSDLFEQICHRVLELHSYEVPEIVALDSYNVSNAYWDWVKKETA